MVEIEKNYIFFELYKRRIIVQNILKAKCTQYCSQVFEVQYVFLHIILVIMILIVYLIYLSI